MKKLSRNKARIRATAWLLLLWLLVPTAYAQECDNLAADAKRLYDTGMHPELIETLPTRLNACRPARDERAEALKYLISSYWHKDELELAEQRMIEFLRLRPNYLPRTGIDPSLFVEKYHFFKVSPKLKVSLGSQFFLYRLARSRSYAPWPQADYTQAYRFALSPGAELQLTWYPVRFLGLAVGAGYNRMSYERHIPGPDEVQINYYEQADQLLVPLMLVLDLPLTRRIYPSLMLGLEYQQLRTATGEITISKGNINNEVLEYYLNDLSPQRQLRNVALRAGMRLNYRVNSFLIHAEVAYAQASEPYTTDTKYAFPRAVTDFYYIDDDFRLASLRLGVGLSYVFSNHIKIRY